jgi:hypothetical protein
MKGLGVTLGLVVLLSVLLLVVAVPTFAGKDKPGNDPDPPAWGHQKNKHDGGDQAAGGQKAKDKAGADDPAKAKSTPVPTDTTPITFTETITICHKPGTPAEKTLVLPAPAVPGHLRHGDYEGVCQEMTSTITATETITICHKPGTPAEKTLVLPAAALSGHMQHGDELGACPDAVAAAPVYHGRWRNRR